jgi:3',5'-cyclic AMP phosphodiesterase CpdA
MKRGIFVVKDRLVNRIKGKGFLFFLGLFALTLAVEVAYLSASERDYHHLVILGDPHLPGRNISLKQKMIDTINAWPDVDMVVAVGDLCEDLGTREEYDAVRQFFSRLNKPLYPVTGNHDYLYEDQKSFKGTRVKAASSINKEKLQRFKETFSLPDLKYRKKVGPYLLIFLSVDDLQSNFLTEISKGTLDWLRSELAHHKAQPTLIFFHAPLKGTLLDYNANANRPNFVAQPEGKVRELILQNSQIFLWVSGHTHTPATNESYASEINLYEKRVTNIHNCDMNRGTIWTNSIYLFPDRVLVKTYDHKKGVWMDHLQRTVRPPSNIP